MSSLLQIAANRKNASRSTGPRTPDGKKRSSLNSLSHGLRSQQLILPGERIEDFNAHREQLLQILAPANALEGVIAERVIVCSWRLNRVVKYETAAAALGGEEAQHAMRTSEESNEDGPVHPISDPEVDQLALAEQDLVGARAQLKTWEGSCKLLATLPSLADAFIVDGGEALNAFEEFRNVAFAIDVFSFDENADDDQFLTALGVPQEQLENPARWDGWHAGMVRQGLAVISQSVKVKPAELLAQALASRRAGQKKTRQLMLKLEKEIKEMQLQNQIREEQSLQRYLLPDHKTMEVIAKYEAHLNRQLLQSLHELQRIQAVRAGEPVAAPAALDVILDGVAAEAASPQCNGLATH